jgi:hypothetical protein
MKSISKTNRTQRKREMNRWMKLLECGSACSIDLLFPRRREILYIFQENTLGWLGVLKVLDGLNLTSLIVQYARKNMNKEDGQVIER